MTVLFLLYRISSNNCALMCYHLDQKARNAIPSGVAGHIPMSGQLRRTQSQEEDMPIYAMLPPTMSRSSSVMAC